MDRLSIILTLAVGSVLTGTLIIAVLSLGWYSWPAIGGAAALGAVLTWPASYALSRRIKRQDPHWDEKKVDRVEGIVPDVSAREV
jgi:NhaP-type Na+/H+ or K+/H+ antiporter